MSIETPQAPEKRESLDFEIKRLEQIHDRIKLLNQRASELFQEEMDIDFKYPLSVKVENNRQKKYESFASPEDQLRIQELKEGERTIKEERDELDKELLRSRFELGLKYLEQINNDSETVWTRVSAIEIDNFIECEHWRAIFKDKVATVKVTKNKVLLFEEGAKQVAQELNDTELEGSLSKWPPRRALPFNEVRMELLVEPRSFFKQNEEVLPGISFSKRFDPYEERYDSTHVAYALGHNAYAFPSFTEDEKAEAVQEMKSLGQKIGVGNL